VSAENVELIRRGYKVFLETGAPSPEQVANDFVWDMSTFAGWPEKKTYEGIEGAMEFLQSWLEAWDDWNLEVEEYLDAGDEVVVICRQSGRSRSSGLPVEMHFSQVWTVRDGLQSRMRMYATPEEGKAAAGLGES
jgi:ketosteroid isomerase-like protein